MEEEVKVELKVTMTPEQYVSIKADASWYNKTVGDYLVSAALGKLPRM